MEEATRGGQFGERRFVQFRARALMLYRQHARKRERFESRQNSDGELVAAARRVQIFDAQQPRTVIMCGIQKAADGSQQRTLVQKSGRRGREPAAVVHRSFAQR